MGRYARFAVMVQAEVPPEAEPTWQQSFEVDRQPATVLDAAEVYLDGAGLVSRGLQGQLERAGDAIVVHHGRIETRITATPTTGGGSQVDIRRAGRAPLEETRMWAYTMGLVGTILAWVLAIYSDRNDAPLPPLASITIFFLGLMAAIAVLYVVDRSLERRSQSLVLSLEEAIREDPMRVLRREVDGLERASSLVNSLLFYAVSILFLFLLFMVLMSDGIREGINEAVTLDVMRSGFLLPLAPAALFGLGYFAWTNRVHGQRLLEVEKRFAAMQSTSPGRGRPRHPTAR